MKKFSYVCAVLAVCGILFTGCTHDLGEHPGYFTERVDSSGMEGTCDHRFEYEYSFLHSTVYPPDTYHYVSCLMYGQTDTCDFAPTFEKHEMTDNSTEPYSEQLYNGRMYHPVTQVCVKCHQFCWNRKYVLAEEDGK